MLAKEKAARKSPGREREPKAQAEVKELSLTASIRFSRLPKTEKKATEERDGRVQAARSKTNLQKTDKPNETPKSVPDKCKIKRQQIDEQKNKRINIYKYNYTGNEWSERDRKKEII